MKNIHKKPEREEKERSHKRKSPKDPFKYKTHKFFFLSLFFKQLSSVEEKRFYVIGLKNSNEN